MSNRLLWDERFEEFVQFCNLSYVDPVEKIRSARRFKDWFESQQGQWHELSPDPYWRYLSSLREREPPYKPSTLYGHFRHALQVAEFYSERGYLLWVPEPGKFLRSPPKGPHRFPPEPADVERLLKVPRIDTPTGIRDRAILELFYGSGLRVGEMAKLRLSDVDLVERTVRIREPKNRRERLVPLTHRSVEALGLYPKRGRPFMLTTKNKTSPGLWLAERNRELKRCSIQSMIHRHSESIGLRISCHDLRHACATHLLRNGASVAHVGRILGHVCLDSTKLYTHLRTLDLAEMLNKCHPRENPVAETSEDF